MRTKYIVGIVAAVMIVAAAFIMLQEKKVDYMDFLTAQHAGKRAQISGTWVKDKGCTYDGTSNHFSFTMRDDKGVEMPVVLEGAKPNNFEISTKIVATGIVDNGTLRATNILTKCPSKYESSGPKPAAS